MQPPAKLHESESRKIESPIQKMRQEGFHGNRRSQGQGQQPLPSKSSRINTARKHRPYAFIFSPDHSEPRTGQLYQMQLRP